MEKKKGFTFQKRISLMVVLPVLFITILLTVISLIFVNKMGMARE